MYVRNSTQPNFQAIKINTVPILKYHPVSNAYVPMDVNLIEFESIPNDIDTLCKIADSWTDSYASNIYASAKRLYEGFFHRNELKIFGITTQTNDFMHLDWSKVLGLMQIKNIEEQENVTIHYLQTHPTNNTTVNKPYYRIGRIFVEMLQNKFESINLFPLKNERVLNFYKKQGFIVNPENEHQLIWRKKTK